VLAGNCLDFSILHSTLQRLKRARVAVSDVAPLHIWSRFQHQAELAKHQAGAEPEAFFSVPEALMPGRKSPVRVRLDGEAFRKLVARHIDSAVDMLNELLDEAGVAADEVQYVLLNGGTTHMAAVRQRISAHFSKAEVRHLPPDAIAHGAALLASEPDKELAEAAPADDRGMFEPAIEDDATLVALLDMESNGPERDARPPASQPPRAPEPPPEPPIDQVTLAQLRSLAQNGERQRAKHRLELLRDAVARELAALEG
jgi:hypothetical protein